MSRLVLASASPRRRELLGALGVEFDVHPSHVDEDPLPGETPFQTQRRVTHAKAATVAATLEDASRWVIACDTTVLLDGDMLNKPADAAEARHMLARLRGRAHEVRSCVVVARAGVAQAAEVATAVQMREYSDAEVEAYIATGDCFDKAGAYAAQHREFHPVARIVGCPLNVIGLPLCRLRGLLPDLPPSEPVRERYAGRPCAAVLAEPVRRHR